MICSIEFGKLGLNSPIGLNQTRWMTTQSPYSPVKSWYALKKAAPQRMFVIRISACSQCRILSVHSHYNNVPYLLIQRTIKYKIPFYDSTTYLIYNNERVSATYVSSLRYLTADKGLFAIADADNC